MKESRKRSRNPAYKKKYRVTTWSEYEKSLRNRGSLTLWISPSAIKAWKAKATGEIGRQQKYSDVAIETVLTLSLLFHLPLRQTQGFVSSFLQSMGLNLPTPDHTTLSRRARTPNIRIKRITSNKPLHLIVELRIYRYMVRVLGQVGIREGEVGESYILWWIEKDSFTVPVFRSGTQKMGVEYHTSWKGLRRKYHR